MRGRAPSHDPVVRPLRPARERRGRFAWGTELQRLEEAFARLRGELARPRHLATPVVTAGPGARGSRPESPPGCRRKDRPTPLMAGLREPSVAPRLGGVPTPQNTAQARLWEAPGPERRRRREGAHRSGDGCQNCQNPLSDPPPMGRLDLVIRKQQVLGSNPSVGSSCHACIRPGSAGANRFRPP